MQLIEQRTEQKVTLVVLFKGDIDKMVGTKARYQVTRLAIFQLLGSNGADLALNEEAKSQFVDPSS